MAIGNLLSRTCTPRASSVLHTSVKRSKDSVQRPTRSRQTMHELHTCAHAGATAPPDWDHAAGMSKDYKGDVADALGVSTTESPSSSTAPRTAQRNKGVPVSHAGTSASPFASAASSSPVSPNRSAVAMVGNLLQGAAHAVVHAVERVEQGLHLRRPSSDGGAPLQNEGRRSSHESFVEIRDRAREHIVQLQQAVTHTPDASSDLAGRMMGKDNYRHPPQPHRNSHPNSPFRSPVRSPVR